MQAPKGPNALHMVGYMNSQEEEQQQMDEGTSSKPNIDVKAIEDQFDNFVEEMQKYDQILSDVAKNIEEIDGEKQFITDFYPSFIWESTYEQDQEKKIVANSDPELAKIILNLERNNKLLKDDMRAWVLQYAKTAKLSEVLISENKVLRQCITKKNKEIVKLINTIGYAENEEITELAENLDVLRQQNGVLKEHLYKLKEEMFEKQRQEERLQNALVKVDEDYKLLQQQKNDAEDEEQHLSKTLELIEQWSSQADRRKKKLEKERDILRMRKREYQEEKDKIQKEIEVCNKERHDLETGLKRQYSDQQSEKYRLMEEIHELGDMIAKHKSECRYFEQQTTRNLAKKQEYENVSKKYMDKVKNSEEQLKKLNKELEVSQEKEVDLDCQIEMEKYDIELLKKEMEELEQKEKLLQDEHKRIDKRNEQARNRQIAQWQSKVKHNQRDLQMKILQEKSELGTKQKELQRWEQKVYDKKEELSDLKTQMKEIKDNQIYLAKLKSQLQAQQKQ